MRIQVITLFPDEFRPLVSLGVTGRALTTGKVRLELLNPRDFARDRHRTVDDRPYGGGPGMVMAVEPLRSTIRAARERAARDQAVSDRVAVEPRVSLLSPQGKLLDQAAVRSLAERQELILVCGRYEGIDERLIELEIDEEWSLGDYVLSGGELAAAVVIGVIPVVQALRVSLVSVLRDDTRTGTGGRGGRVLRHGLVVAQVAFALKRPELGSLKPGSAGDATILSVDDGQFDYVDVRF